MGKFTSKIEYRFKMKLFSAFIFAFAAVEAKKVREPDWRVNQLQRKLTDVMAAHYSKYDNWSTRMNKQSRKIADRMIRDWEKRAGKCEEAEGSGEGSGDWEEDNLERGDRYDADDKCRAARQLTRNMITWSRRYNTNTDCETGEPIDGATNKYFNKIQKSWEKYEQKMKKKGKCAE